MSKRHEHSFHQRRYTLAKKLMEGCSTSLAIREIQIKTMRYFYFPVQIVSISGKDTEKLADFYIAGANKMVHFLWKTVWQFLKHVTTI